MRKRVTSVAVVLIAALFGAAGRVGAGQAAATATPTFTISITEAAELIESVGTTRRLDRGDIELLHARTLDEVLRKLPGIYVRTGGDGAPRLDVRGFRSRHVLLLVDGVPINSTNDGQFDPRQIAMDAVREIKVSYGSSSMLYGDNALAGVIEIITDTAAEGVHGGAKVGAGQTAEREGEGRVEVGRGPVSLVVSGNAYQTDGFRLAGDFASTANQTAGVRANSDIDRRGVLAKVGYSATNALNLGALVSFTTGSFGLPPITANSATDPFAQQVRFERVNGYDNIAFQTSLGYAASSAFRLQAWAYRNSEDEDRARFDDATYSSMSNRLISGTFQELNRSRLTGGQSILRFDLGRAGWLRASVSGRRESFATAGVIRDVAAASGGGTGGGGGGGGSRNNPTPTPATFNTRTFDESHRGDVLSAGGEWEFRPAPRGGVVLGVSQNWQRRNEAANSAGTGWLAGFSWALAGGAKLRASATRKVRFPSLQQLYDPSAGDLGLQPERAYEVEGGVEKFWGPSQVGVAVFTTRATNFIERNQGARYQNRERYRFSGVEITAEHPVANILTLHGGYTFMNSADLSGGDGSAGLQYRPRHRLTIDTRWVLHPKVSARAAVQYVADQVYFSRGTPAIQAEADNYALLDVSVDGKLSERLWVTAVAANAVDTFYEQGYGFPRAGRTFRVTLGTKF